MRGSLWLPPTGGDFAMALEPEGNPQEWAFEGLDAMVEVDRSDEDSVLLALRPVYTAPAGEGEHDVGVTWLFVSCAGALGLAGDLARAATQKWVLHPPPSPVQVAAELKRIARSGGPGPTRRLVAVEELEHLAWALEASAPDEVEDSVS